MPTYHGNFSAAVAITYRGNDGTPVEVSFKPAQYGLDYVGGYRVIDLFTGENLGSKTANQIVSFKVNPNGKFRLLRSYFGS